MRPRKVILLLDPDENTRRERTLILDLRGTYRVIPAETPANAKALLEGHSGIDLLIVSTRFQMPLEELLCAHKIFLPYKADAETLLRESARALSVPRGPKPKQTQIEGQAA